MSVYFYTPLNGKILMSAEAWIDDVDVNANIVYGLRNSDGTAITNGTASVAVDSLAPLQYEDELDISGLGLVEGTAYDLYISLTTSRVSASPTPSIFSAHMQKTTLSVDMLTESDKSFAFQSQATGSDEVFYAGGYNLFNGNDNFAPLISFGTANVAYGAHFFIVTGAIAANEITIAVVGTSIDDEGTRTTSDSENIVIPAFTAANNYFETTKKWLSQVTVVTTGGTAIECNYGYAKYWDNNNDDFTVLGLDTTWFGGASDDVDFVIYHHKVAGWTYNVGAEPSPPELVRMTDDYTTTDDKTASGAFCAWKRSNLSTFIEGSASEGIVLSAISSKASSFQIGNTVIKIRS